MEVILREHVDNLGRRGEVVKVADGYARNYLLPRKLALAVTEATSGRSSARSKVAEARTPKRSRRPRRCAQRLDATEIEIARRVGENNTLYGRSPRPTSRTRCEAKGFEIDKRKIQLRRSAQGARRGARCRVKVHRDVTAQVKVKVVAEQR